MASQAPTDVDLPPSAPSLAPPSFSEQIASPLPDRLGYEPKTRIWTATLTAFATGALLGISQGATTSALRFRAENSHRLPSNKGGWYLYHKAKNFYVMREAITEGLVMGTRLAPWVGLFFLVEHAVDEVRDDVEEWDWKLGREIQPGRHKDFLATTVAGLSVAGGYSAYQRMAFPTAARMCKLGLITGLGFGLAQDGLKLLTGGRLAYIDLIKRSFGWNT